MEYAATITVNPLTALRMLEDFVKLNSGTFFLSCYNEIHAFKLSSICFFI